MDFNRFEFIGNVGKDGVVAHEKEASGHFELAVSSSWRDKAGKDVERTDWFRITLWNGQFEAARKHLGKGARVFVEGEIRNNNWEHETGVRIYGQDFVARRVIFLSSGDRKRGEK